MNLSFSTCLNTSIKCYHHLCLYLRWLSWCPYSMIIDSWINTLSDTQKICPGMHWTSQTDNSVYWHICLKRYVYSKGCRQVNNISGTAWKYPYLGASNPLHGRQSLMLQNEKIMPCLHIWTRHWNPDRMQVTANKCWAVQCGAVVKYSTGQVRK